MCSSFGFIVLNHLKTASFLGVRFNLALEGVAYGTFVALRPTAGQYDEGCTNIRICGGDIANLRFAARASQ